MGSELRPGPYGRIYATAAFHPKHVAAGDADGVYWRGVAWALDNSDDGFIPDDIVTALGGAKARQYRSRLIAVGLWVVADGGVVIHDYPDHQVPRDERDRQRRVATERKRKQRESGNGHGHVPRDIPRDVTRDMPVTSRDIEVEIETVANATAPKPPKSGAVPASVQEFQSLWNANCEPLPILRKPPPRNHTLIAEALDAADHRPELLAAGIRVAAADPHYRAGHFGWEAFCRHVARWIPAALPGEEPPEQIPELADSDAYIDGLLERRRQFQEAPA